MGAQQDEASSFEDTFTKALADALSDPEVLTGLGINFNRGEPGSTAGQPTAQSDLSPLYIGYGPRPLAVSQVPAEALGRLSGVPIPNTVFGGSKWLTDLQANDPTSYKQVVDMLRQSGLLGKGSNAQSSIDAAWKRALELASSVEGPDGTKGTEVLSYLAQKAADPTTEPVGKYTGPTTTTSVDVSSQLSTAFDAKALVNNALGQYLGRKATQSELEQFHSMLNAQQTANPQVTNQTVTNTPTGLGTATQSRQTSTSGGMSAAANAVVAEEYAQSRDTYAGTQANTTLMGWLEEALLGPAKGKQV